MRFTIFFMHQFYFLLYTFSNKFVEVCIIIKACILKVMSSQFCIVWNHQEILKRSGFTYILKALFNNVSTFKKKSELLSVSVIWSKNETLKKLHFESVIKCFEEVKIYKWPDLPFSFSPIDCSVRINHEPDGL